MTYDFRVQRPAIKALGRLPRPLRERIWLRIEGLADNPRPRGCKLLTGALEGHYRIRVGGYRVVYTVDDEQRRVWVVRVGPRGSVYRG